MKIKVSKKDVIWNYAGVIASLGSNLLMLPIVLYFLTGAQVGLWYVFQSMASLSTMFDFGFTPTFSRNVAYCWSGTDKLKAEDVSYSCGDKVNYHLLKQIIYTCKYIYLLISLVVLIGFSSVGTVYVFHVSSALSGYGHKISWGIWCIALFLNLYYGYFASLLKGVGAVAESNKGMVFARLAQFVSLIILLIAGTGLIGVSISYLIYGVVLREIYRYYFNHYNDIGDKLKKTNYKPDKRDIWDLFKIIWHNAWKEGAVSLANYFCNQMGTIVSSLYLSLEETGIYSMGVQLASAMVTFAYAMYTSYQPSIQSAISNKDDETVRKNFSYTVFVYIVIVIIGTAVLISAGPVLIRIVKPEMNIGRTVLLGVTVYQFILKFRNCYTSYLSNSNRIIYFKAFMVFAVVCVGLEFLLCGVFNMGMWGLVAAQIISQLVYNFWHWPLVVHKELKMSFIDLIKLGYSETRKKFIRKSA